MTENKLIPTLSPLNKGKFNDINAGDINLFAFDPILKQIKVIKTMFSEMN